MKVTTPIDVGHFIASIRKTKGWSQSELAQKIGKDQRFISKVENDPSSSAFGSVMEILTALGVKTDLYTDDSQPPGQKSRPTKSVNPPPTPSKLRGGGKKPAIVKTDRGPRF